MIWALTAPIALPDEAKRLNDLLGAGLDILVLRKPGGSCEQLLEQLDTRYYRKILLAGPPEIAARLGLLGVHMSEARRQALPGGLQKPRGLYGSTAIHSDRAIPLLSQYWDSLLLSPVFDSISKPGYKAGSFRLTGNHYAKLVALGGINAETAPLAKSMGFDGVALMGALWENVGASLQTFERIKQAWRNT